MTMRASISSFQNSKIKLANKLVSKRHREKNDLFIIDYERDLSRALDNGYDVAFAFYCDELASEDDKAVLSRLTTTDVYDVASDLMEKASYRQNPGGIVAIMRQKPTLSLDDLAELDSPHLLALVSLRKPGNIGALLRTADASGFGIICLIDSVLDLYNPNIIRSSTGAVFLRNIVQMSTDEALTYFKSNDIAIVAAHLSGTQSLYDLDFTAQRTAIALGTEDTGLDEKWVNHSDALVKIPMMGRISDSLNVSVSGAVFMYEALRQRLASTT